MKKLMSGFLSLMLFAPALVMAQGGNHPMGGCGLGYVLFGKSSPGGTVQICAYTTNGSTFNQVFGITSGTSGCTPDGMVAFNKQTENFVEINYDSLKSDIASGQGEYINALVDLLGVKDTKKSSVKLLLKQDYQTLFPSQNTTFDAFLRNLQKTLTDNNELLV